MKKLNNAGFSLVEIIIAVVILAIVVPVFVHCFVTGAVVGRKSRETLNATALSEDLMEIFEDVNIEAYMQSLGAPVTPDSNGVYTIDIDAALLATITGESFVGDEYSANIVFDPCTAEDSGNETYKAVNTMNTVNIAELGGKKTAIYSMPASFDIDACDTIAKKSATNENYSKDFVYANVKRTITVEILDNGVHASGVRFAKVLVTVTHEYGSDEYKTTMQSFIFDNTVDDSKTAYPLENIYILYTPIYNAGGTDNTYDNIYIRNDDNIPVNVFLIKENSADANYDTLGGNGNGYGAYKVNVEITEGHKNATVDESFTPSISLMTTLFDVSSIGKFNYDGTVTDGVGKLHYKLSYKASATERTTVNNQALLNKILKVYSADGRAIFKDSASRNRIYEMTVTIYKSGEPYVEVTGSKIQ